MKKVVVTLFLIVCGLFALIFGALVLLPLTVISMFIGHRALKKQQHMTNTNQNIIEGEYEEVAKKSPREISS